MTCLQTFRAIFLSPLLMLHILPAAVGGGHWAGGRAGGDGGGGGSGGGISWDDPLHSYYLVQNKSLD